MKIDLRKIKAGHVVGGKTMELITETRPKNTGNMKQFQEKVFIVSVEHVIQYRDEGKIVTRGLKGPLEDSEDIIERVHYLDQRGMLRSVERELQRQIAGIGEVTASFYLNKYMPLSGIAPSEEIPVSGYYLVEHEDFNKYLGLEKSEIKY
jgi:hypothetical protein